uniref:rhophilin-2-like n=1 Tax=Myxine glutinosa TaxID=7769 RepID=UPI00358F7BC7
MTDIESRTTDGLDDDHPFRKGCDPFYNTRRGKLQNQRMKLNHKIGKAARMQAGAHNLLRATTNSKVRNAVELELSYTKANLLVLQDELAVVNSSVQTYQDSSSAAVALPLIPLGLKETVDVDFGAVIGDFLEEHYGENRLKYSDEIDEFIKLRLAARTPKRCDAGLDLLREYYTELLTMKEHFMPSFCRPNMLFIWYDSLTGLPCYGNSLEFEQASILFNMAALYTQLGTCQDRSTPEGLNSALQAFCQAAGILNVIAEQMPQGETPDLTQEMLHLLVNLLLCQAEEVTLEKHIMQEQSQDFNFCITIARKATQVMESYAHLTKLAETDKVLPLCWKILLQIKKMHFQAVAYFFMGLALLDHRYGAEESNCAAKQEQVLLAACATVPDGLSFSRRVHRDDERTRFGMRYLDSALAAHNMALCLHGTCPELSACVSLKTVLAVALNRTLCLHEKASPDDDDYYDVPIILHILPQAFQEVVPQTPALHNSEKRDIFQRLGPPAVFCARRCVSTPRKAYLMKSPSEGYGMRLGSDSPVVVTLVQPGGIAMHAGINEGDYIVAVCGTECRWATQAGVADLMKCAPGNRLELEVVTPGRNSHSHFVDGGLKRPIYNMGTMPNTMPSSEMPEEFNRRAELKGRARRSVLRRLSQFFGRN